MALEKITEQQLNENGVCAAPDILNGTPAQNKAVFDRLIRSVMAVAFNHLIEELNAAGVETTVQVPEGAGFKYLRLNSNQVLEFSDDGETWRTTASQIVDGEGNELGYGAYVSAEDRERWNAKQPAIPGTAGQVPVFGEDGSLRGADQVRAETAALYGLGAEAVPDDVLALLHSLVQTAAGSSPFNEVVEVIDTSKNWIAPQGIIGNRVTVLACGGGGAGGAGIKNSLCQGYGGGGGSGFITIDTVEVTHLASYPIVIGAGGAAAANGNGGNGGETKFCTFVSAPGGYGGGKATYDSVAAIVYGGSGGDGNAGGGGGAGYSYGSSMRAGCVGGNGGNGGTYGGGGGGGSAYPSSYQEDQEKSRAGSGGNGGTYGGGGGGGGSYNSNSLKVGFPLGNGGNGGTYGGGGGGGSGRFSRGTGGSGGQSDGKYGTIGTSVFLGGNGGKGHPFQDPLAIFMGAQITTRGDNGISTNLGGAGGGGYGGKGGPGSKEIFGGGGGGGYGGNGGHTSLYNGGGGGGFGGDAVIDENVGGGGGAGGFLEYGTGGSGGGINDESRNPKSQGKPGVVILLYYKEGAVSP